MLTTTSPLFVLTHFWRISVGPYQRSWYPPNIQAADTVFQWTWPLQPCLAVSVQGRNMTISEFACAGRQARVCSGHVYWDACFLRHVIAGTLVRLDTCLIGRMFAAHSATEVNVRTNHFFPFRKEAEQHWKIYFKNILSWKQNIFHNMLFDK